MQSILDVFVVQGLISAEDADKLKRSYKTNQDIERILISNRIVTKETINKAYSILLKLPYISLENTKIDSEVLNIIPKKIASRYGVVSFGLKDNSLQLAISRPSSLDSEFNQNLDRIMDNKPYRIDLFITGPDDLNEVMKQYTGSVDSPTKLSSSSLPVVYLRNQNLSISLLKRLPLDFIEKHRAVIFYQKNDFTFAMAAERPDSYEVRKTVEFLQKENKIKIQLFATSAEDIDYAIGLYKGALEDEGLMKKKQDEPAKVEIKDTPDKIIGEMEAAKKKIVAQSALNQPKNDEQKEKKQENSFSLSGLFSGLRSKNDQTPAITIDSYEKVTPNKDGDNADIAPLEQEQQAVEAKPSEIADPVPSEQVGVKADEDSQVGEQEALDKLIEVVPAKDPEPGVTIEENKAQAEVRAASQDGDKETEIGSLLDADINTDEDLKKVLSENYIPKVVAAIVNYALTLRSSDIHIEARAKDLRVRYRVDGILRDIAKLPLSMHPPMISRIKILSKMKIDETRIPQDGRFEVKFKNREVDVRVSALPTVHGEKMVMRVLDKDQGILSLEDLGMSGRAFDITIENIARPYGIILSTGPTGSGKSTTLYAILNRISTPSVNIITLEDPVEYEIAGVNQCQIKPAIGFTFAEGLRSVLRQDPNVVMVGEIRDGETAAMATHAALTGHLVLSTLHTNDSAGALPRLINMGIEPFLITSSINEIIAQRLIRRICPKCKEEMRVPQALVDEIKKELDLIPQGNKRDLARLKPDMKFYHGVGCPDCNQGYRGRVGLFEVLRMTDRIEELAISKQSANDIKQAAIEDGMITMRQDGILKCLEGLTTIDEVFRATSN